MMEHYILKADGRTAEPVDMMTWARWFEDNSAVRTVARKERGGVLISTVFLGLNHQYDPDGPPLIFETMIFGGALDHYQIRCSTYEQAEQQHLAACALAFTWHRKWLYVLGERSYWVRCRVTWRLRVVKARLLATRASILARIPRGLR